MALDETDVDTEEGADVPDLTPERAEATDGSMLGRLRKLRKQSRDEDRTEDFNIPGYNRLLIARYKVVEWEQLRNVAKKFEKNRNPKKELFAHIDTLLKANVGIFITKPDHDAADETGLAPLAALEPGWQSVDGEEVTTYKDVDDLARIMEFESIPKTARGAVRMLFPNDLAITSHYNDVTAWMEGSTEEDDDEFVGNSEDGRK